MVKYRLANYLMCPICKTYPLELTIFKEVVVEDRDIQVNPCDYYCAYLDKREAEIVDPPCRECMKHEIIDGYYRCGSCGEWYPIIDKIAIMHHGEYRPKKAIREFIERYRDKIPSELIQRELSRERS